MIVNKKDNKLNSELFSPDRPQNKNKRKRKYISTFTRELKDIKVIVISIIIGALGSVKKTGSIGNKRTRGEHPDYSIISFKQFLTESKGLTDQSLQCNRTLLNI